MEDLLEAFVKDTKLSHDQVIKALKDMNSKKDIRDVFQASIRYVCNTCFSLHVGVSNDSIADFKM